MRQRRYGGLRVAFQMAPMIDIIFLLLIFFICVSTFDRLESEQDVQLAPAKAWKKIEKEKSTLLINITRSGNVTINQISFFPGQAEAFLRSLAARHGDTFEVIVRADRSARYESTKDVISACARAGLTRVSFAVERKK
jgi:biopolymer transport protein ExbD